VYQYDQYGFYAGEINDHGGPLPNNATRKAPQMQVDWIPRWTGTAWEQVENHKGRQGYVNGAPSVIKDYGPLPPGWSDTPPPPTLDEARAAKLSEVMTGYGAAFADMEKVYPQHEREGWPIQEAEAMAYMGNPALPTPVLSALVQLRNRGETVAQLVTEVIRNAEGWRMYYAWYTGQQQRMYAEVSALATVSAIKAYQVFYAPLPAQGAGA
jgi:hypothetical protein